MASLLEVGEIRDELRECCSKQLHTRLVQMHGPRDLGSCDEQQLLEFVKANAVRGAHKEVQLGVEIDEEDAEVVIARLDSMTDTVTMPILVRYTEKEYKRLLQDVQKGKMSESTTKLTGIKECFEELSVNEGIILRGKWLLIPTKLRPDVLDVAHEGCPGGDSMLRQLRMDVWWPWMHALQLTEMEVVCQGKGICGQPLHT